MLVTSRTLGCKSFDQNNVRPEQFTQEEDHD